MLKTKTSTFWATLLPLLTVMLGLLYWVYLSEARSIRNYTQLEGKQTLLLKERAAENYFKEIESEFRFITNTYTLYTHKGELESAQELLLSLAEYQGKLNFAHFYPVEGLEKESPESLAYIKHAGRNHTHKLPALLVAKCLTLEKGEILMSGLEIDEITQQPVIYLAAPVFNLFNQRMGYIAAQYAGSVLIERLLNYSQEATSVLSIINKNGHYLHAEDANLLWGHVYPQRSQRTLQKIDPLLWEQLNQTHATPNNIALFGNHSYTSIDIHNVAGTLPYNPEQPEIWHFVLSTPSSIVSGILSEARNFLILLGVGITLVLGIICSRLAKLRTNQLQANQHLQHLKTQAEEARTRAEQADNVKTRFMNVMSHELRTPLTVILGNIPLLTNKDALPPAEEIALIAKDIQNDSKRLLTTITNVLDIAKIEAEQLTLNLDIVALHELTEEVMYGIRKQLAESPYENTIKLSSHVPKSFVEGDHARLKQTLTHLLENALKFTQEGSVTLKGILKEDTIHLTVADTGAGIPKEALGRIFEVFEQGDGSHTRKAEGSGLGLAITHRLVRLHGGAMLVASEEGTGSQFTLSLPLADSSELQPGEAFIKNEGEHDKPKTDALNTSGIKRDTNSTYIKGKYQI